MKEPKLTPCFPRGVKPHRKGVYLGDPQGKRATYQHWNGRFWGVWCWSIKHANNKFIKSCESRNQNPSWRGLSEKPS